MQEIPEDEDDALVFRAAVAGVRQLTATHQPPGHGKLPAPHPRQTEADERAVIAELLADPEPDLLETGETLLYRSDGVQDGVMRKLRRGQYRIESELDLHGCNREKARLQVAQFLAHCQNHRLRCVRIIHGKGNGSPNSGPVLKSYVASWLQRRKEVLAYCSARPVDGGTGAVYVLLRTSGASA